MSDKHLPEEPRPISAALNHFLRHGGMLRTLDALVAGIHPRTLYALRDSGRDWRSRPAGFPVVVAALGNFLGPLEVAITTGQEFALSWHPSGLWQ
ncbi:MAG UNVERIFIED_CONTAM: type IV toxin-antitoxin system AbiEi family antitoxin domain-containing protein [Planctomycetaceae bacterium]|jgi:hypothetical protein